MKIWLRRLGVTVLVAIVAIIWLQARRVRTLPDLEPWHTVELESEFTARDTRGDFDFADYLAKEVELYDELAERVVRPLGSRTDLEISRFEPGGFNNPEHFPRNWNRTFELIPEQTVGGALLLHGLSDSPYSLRRVGEILHTEGFHVIGLRIPGHGTMPSGLVTSNWQDALAAVQVAETHLRREVAGRGPIFFAGYSNGATLALKFTLDAIADSHAVPDRLLLFSPAIAVSSAARFAGAHRLLSFMPYFEKLRWLGIQPEFDPYKYNSFAKDAALQSFRLTRAVSKQIGRLNRRGLMGQMPPVLSFASLVDSTVLGEAIVDRLYDHLAGTESELVVFDVNRLALMRPFFRREVLQALDALEESEKLVFRLTVLTNDDVDSRELMEWSRAAGASKASTRELGLVWPSGVYSLSHVAVSFPPDDPVYGRFDEITQYGLPIGALEPRGERNVLRVPADQFLRLRHNPFFSYIEERLRTLQ